MSVIVPNEGRMDAKIACYAEAPAEAEEKQGRPLVGPSGNKWKVFLADAGLTRQGMRVGNVINHRAPGNVMDAVPAEEIVGGIVNLRAEVEQLEDPHVIVTMGNYATYALTGKGNVKASVRKALNWADDGSTMAEKKAGVTKLRGSIYEYIRQDGRRVKVIPTIHPAALFRNPKWEKRCFVDWRRIAREATFPERIEYTRRHVTSPDARYLSDYCTYIEANPHLRLAVDIETWGRTLSCVGFAHTMLDSVTVPLVGADNEWAWDYVRRLCGGVHEKILHNGFYDWYWLAWYGVELRGFLWDTMLMHHALDPAENHSLDYVSSLYCPDHRYWKDEAKDAEEIVKYASDLESLWTYNGMDCCRTRELFDILSVRLGAEGLTEFYRRHYSDMFEPLIRTMLGGIRVDKQAQKAWSKRLKVEMKKIRAYLAEAAGEELLAQDRKAFFREPTPSEWEKLLGFGEYAEWEPRIDKGEIPKSKDIHRDTRQALIDEHGVTYMISGQNAGKMRDYKLIDKKSFSGKKLHKFFYETLKLPKQTRMVRTEAGRERRETLDEGAVRKMTMKYRGKIGDYGTELLRYRELEGEANDTKGSWDKDGRMRCSYTMLTEAGRLSSRKNPRGTGRNLQNVKR